MDNPAGKLPAAGWYPDPEHPDDGRRYWDGRVWTDRHADWGHHLPAPANPPRSLANVQVLAIVGLLCIAIIEAFGIYASLKYIAVGDDLVAGHPPSLSDLNDATDLQDTSGIAHLVGYLAIGPLTFLPWFYSAYLNLPGFGVPRLRYAPGWAIGSWFIPIFNLFRPKQIANDLYRASQPGTTFRTAFWERPVSPLLHWWWALFLLQGVIGFLGSRIASAATEGSIVTPNAARGAIEDEQVGIYLYVVSSVIAIAAVVLAILVVRRITAAQDNVVRGITTEPGDVLETLRPSKELADESAPTVRGEEPADGGPVNDEPEPAVPWSESVDDEPEPPARGGGGDVAPPAGAPVGGVCPKCGRASEAGDAFCSHCGTRLVKHCASCGEPVVTEGRFCPYCGATYVA